MFARVAASVAVVSCGGSSAPVDVASPSSGGAFANGDELSYVLEDAGGRTLGRVHGRVSREAGELALVTRVAYGDPAAATVEYATTLRDDRSLLAYKRLSSVEGRLQLQAGGGFLNIITDIAQKKVPYEPKSRAFVLGRDDLLALALAVEQSGLAPGASGALEARIAETGALESIPVQVYADASRRTVVKLPDGKAILDPRGYVMRFERDDGSAYVLKPTAEAPPKLLPVPQPARYERPRAATWDDREVLIDVDQGRLAGVVSVPKLRARWTKKLSPGVLVLGDLPQTNRHGFGTTTDYGRWELFDRLADEGFAVLRLDDRGVGSSRTEIDPAALTIEQRVADAEAQYDFLKRQRGVDPDRIFVVGHGFGALEATLLAARVPVTAVVLIAPPYRSVAKVLAEREVNLHETPPVEAERRMNLLLSVFAGNEAAKAQVPARIVALYRHAEGRLTSAAKIDFDAALAKLEVPIAVFQGLKDFETSWKDDAQALERAVNDRRRRQAKLFVYADVDHLMKTTNGPSTLAAYADRGRRLAPKMLDDLVEWLAAQVK